MVNQWIDPVTASGNLLIRPNRSLSWPATRRWLTALSAFTLVLGAAFAWRGLWPILAVACLQVLALWGLVYGVLLRQQRREWISLTSSEVVVRIGRYRPEQEVRFPRAWTRVVLRPGVAAGHPRELYLCCGGRRVQLARDLREDERESLWRCLHALLPVAVGSAGLGCRP